MLADVLCRNNAQNYEKPPIYRALFSSAIGNHNLLVAEGNEHEQARQMINPAFHHINTFSTIQFSYKFFSRCSFSSTVNF